MERYNLSGLAGILASVSFLPSIFPCSPPSFYLSDNVERGLPPSLHPTPAGDDGLAHSLTLSFATLLQGTFHATVQAVMEMHKILCWLAWMNLNLISSVDWIQTSVRECVDFVRQLSGRNRQKISAIAERWFSQPVSHEMVGRPVNSNNSRSGLSLGTFHYSNLSLCRGGCLPGRVFMFISLPDTPLAGWFWMDDGILLLDEGDASGRRGLVGLDFPPAARMRFP